MQILDHGPFEAYVPDVHPLLEMPGVLFCKNPAGEDWYEFQRLLIGGTIKALVNDAGVVCSVSREASALFPAGYRLIEITGDVDMEAQRYRRLVDGAIVDPPAPVLTKVAKADLWRRLTEPEAVTLDAALQAAPLRLRRVFEAAQYLDTTDEDYPALRAGIVGALGEARANEVLAPTY